MTRKIKVLSLGLFAMLAMSAVAITNAGAEQGGVFDTGSEHTIVQGTESGTHKLELGIEGLTNKITCENASYAGTTTGTTATKITITPSYANCDTTGGEPGSVEITMNECDYEFTIGTQPEETTNTVDVECPEGEDIEIHHPSCLITIPEQTNLKGVAYTNKEEGGFGTITLDANVTGITTHFHGGICQLLGTTHKGTMTGSATVKGFDTEENQVNVKATG